VKAVRRSRREKARGRKGEGEKRGGGAFEMGEEMGEGGENQRDERDGEPVAGRAGEKGGEDDSGDKGNGGREKGHRDSIVKRRQHLVSGILRWDV
jgi:hypothetical protein